MALQMAWHPHTLDFTFAAGTSRGVLREKKTWYLKLWDTDHPETFGLGEAGPLVGLSIDDRPEITQELDRLAELLNGLTSWPQTEAEVIAQVALWVDPAWPSIRFGLETALLDLNHGGQRIIYPGPFTEGKASQIINGLIWMGDAATMERRLEEKLEQGFTTIKLKIGAINFEDELRLLSIARQRFDASELTLRVDANGAFHPNEAIEKLNRLAEYDLHSIEQPIAVQQWDAMTELCQQSPIPIALDEELIGVHERVDRIRLLERIRPPYIILKPTLVGGIGSTREWITLAEERNIGWWMTSALESNVGLNAIAQLTATYQSPLPQGLGTGQLYHNNIPSPLTQAHGHLRYGETSAWDFGPIFGN